MHSGRGVFAQVMSSLPLATFARIAARYDEDRFFRSLRCTDQYPAMVTVDSARLP